MKILGVLRARNSQDSLPATLRSLSRHCDAVYALNDRSTDGSLRLLRACPKVKNIFNVDPAVSDASWFFPEWLQHELLYRMADFYRPDWMFFLDDDTTMRLEGGGELRALLAKMPRDVVGIEVTLDSRWRDPRYPLMPKLMRHKPKLRLRIFRYNPGYSPAYKVLHVPPSPRHLDKLGKTVAIKEIVFLHGGWDTLEKRIAKVDFYTARDPEYAMNGGVPYDQSLLFGYAREKVDALIGTYRRRYQARRRRAQ